MSFSAFSVRPVRSKISRFSLAKQRISSQLNQYRAKCNLFLQLYNKLLKLHRMHFRSIPSARKYSATKFRVSTDCWFAATQQQCYTPTPNGGALPPSHPGGCIAYVSRPLDNVFSFRTQFHA